MSIVSHSISYLYLLTSSLDWLHGGLQFQVVHHLFPRIPRHKLREVRDKYFLPFVSEFGLDYQIYDFIESNKRVLRTLRNAAEKAKKVPDNKLKSAF